MLPQPLRFEQLALDHFVREGQLVLIRSIGAEQIVQLLADAEREITEEELLAFILDWKKSWNSEEKKAALSSAIRNLVILSWMRARISESVDEAAA